MSIVLENTARLVARAMLHHSAERILDCSHETVKNTFLVVSFTEVFDCFPLGIDVGTANTEKIKEDTLAKEFFNVRSDIIRRKVASQEVGESVAKSGISIVFIFEKTGKAGLRLSSVLLFVGFKLSFTVDEGFPHLDELRQECVLVRVCLGEKLTGYVHRKGNTVELTLETCLKNGALLLLAVHSVVTYMAVSLHNVSSLFLLDILGAKGHG